MGKRKCFSIVLPDMWVTEYHKRRGRRVPLYSSCHAHSAGNSIEIAKHLHLLSRIVVASAARFLNEGSLKYYLNVRTREKFYSKAEFYGHFRQIAEKFHVCFWKDAWVNRSTAEEKKDQTCNSCKERGHNCLSCPYPVIQKTNPYSEKRYRRCSRCQNVGHNIRSCDFPPQFYPKHLIVSNSK